MNKVECTTGWNTPQFSDPATADLRNHRSLRSQCAKDFAQFDWTHFCTLTFRKPTNIETAAKRFRTWTRRLEQRAQHRINYIMAPERHQRGTAHVHAILAGLEGFPSSWLAASWVEMEGRIEIEPYDPERGGAFYLTKTIGTSNDWWDCNLNGLTRIAAAKSI